jgi:hypothetical protein
MYLFHRYKVNRIQILPSRRSAIRDATSKGGCITNYSLKGLTLFIFIIILYIKSS